MRTARLFLRRKFPAIAQVIILAMTLSFAHPLWAQNVPQYDPMRGIAADLIVKTKYRPVADFDKSDAWLGDPDRKSETELEQDLATVTQWRQIEGKNWQLLQQARRAQTARIPFSPVIAAARLTALARERQLSIDRLHELENDEFRQKNHFTLHDPIFEPTPDQQRIIEAWMKPSAGDARLPRHRR